MFEADDNEDAQLKESLERFRQRRKKILKGEALPTVMELLRGAPFFRDDWRADMAHWSSVTVLGMRDGESGDLVLQLSKMPSDEELVQAHRAFQELAKDAKPESEVAKHAVRVSYYAAVSGYLPAIQLVAAETNRRAHEAHTTPHQGYDLLKASLGWLAVSSLAALANDPEFFLDPPDTMARDMAVASMDRLRTMETAINRVAAAKSGLFGEIEHVIQNGVVVIKAIGSHDSTEGRRIVTAYKEIIGQPLPLVKPSHSMLVRETLLHEFPHATNVIDTMLGDMVGRDHARLRPTILVGSPGCGKTTLAVRLLETLSVPHTIFPCGGAADSSVTGCSRKWATGTPSLPFALMHSHRTASPGIVLDELEKVGTGHHNGNLLDALLSMLEPRSASRWLDQYLDAEIDLSHVLWLGTANSLEGVPSPFRDRCRVLRFPDPRPEHMPSLANALLENLLLERGFDSRWVVPLDGLELEALAQHWRGGSIRKLNRLVEGVLATRDRWQGFQ